MIRSYAVITMLLLGATNYSYADDVNFDCKSSQEGQGYWIQFRPEAKRLLISGLQFQSEFTSALKPDFAVMDVPLEEGQCQSTNKSLQCRLVNVMARGWNVDGVGIGTLKIHKLRLGVEENILDLSFTTEVGQLAKTDIPCEVFSYP